MFYLGLLLKSKQMCKNTTGNRHVSLKVLICTFSRHLGHCVSGTGQKVSLVNVTVLLYKLYFIAGFMRPFLLSYLGY